MNDALLFVSRRFGLHPEALGSGAVFAAVRARMEATGLSDSEDYLRLAGSDLKEQELLRDRLLIPETWFFRDTAPFENFGKWALARYAEKKKPLRVLCLACATGEEAYSAAACLFMRGLSDRDFSIDAMDLSQSFLDRARTGVYGKVSLREKGAVYPPDLFTPEGNGVRVTERLKSAVRFLRGDALRSGDLTKNGPYDAIFFRNALIYLTPQAQGKATHNADTALCPGGLLVLGFAEPPSVFFPGYEPMAPPRCYSAIKPALQEKTGPAAEAHPRAAMSVPAARPAPAHPSRPRLPRSAPSAPFPCPREENPAGEMAMAMRLADKGELDRAWEMLGRICARQPEDPEACFLSAQVALGLDRDDEAEEWLRRTLYLSPGHARALGVFRVLLLSQGRTEEADVMEKRLSRVQGDDIAKTERRGL